MKHPHVAHHKECKWSSHGYSSALFFARIYNNDALESLLWKAEKDINAVIDKRGDTLLHFAARMNYEPLINIIVESGSGTERKNAHFNTPLHVATKHNNEDVVVALLNSGADINAIDGHGNTALIIAAAGGHEKLVRTLVQRGANQDLVNHTGNTALIRAAAEGHDEVVKFLIVNRILSNEESEGWLNKPNHYGMTALTRAVVENRKSTVKILLRMGADPFIKTHAGDTSITLARKKKHKSVEMILRTHKTTRMNLRILDVRSQH